MAESISVLAPGTILDSGETRYRVVNVLGQGGFGITYLVMGEVKVGNVTTEAKFAIKEHFPTAFCKRSGNEVVPDADKQAEFEHSKNDFISEAKKLYALGSQNENIVKVNEIFATNGTAYYVMQYINGVSLTKYVESKGKLTYTEAVKLLSPIIDAVGFLHKSRINHLDIKPDNIMLHDGVDGVTPILIDFGLSVHFKKNGDKTSPKGVQGVSEGYSPLEQYAGIKEFIPATDIYALMATLLFTLTGTRPRPASELKTSEVREALKRIVPQQALDGICKALNKSYEDRTPSIGALKADMGLSTGGSSTVVIDVNDKDDARKRKMLYIGIAAALAVIVLIIALWPKSGAGEKASEPVVADSVIADTTAVATDTVVPVPQQTVPETQLAPQPQQQQPAQQSPAVQQQATQPQPAPAPQPTSGTLSLGYGSWRGGIYGGKPDGKGTLTFTSTHQVDRSVSVMANPGDYFVATYERGALISGKLYDADGNLIKTIIP